MTNWTQLGSPYLWWTGADQAPVLQATVNWGVSSGRLVKGKTVGVVVSDQASDQTALNQYMLPYLKKAGIPAKVLTVAANPDELRDHQFGRPVGGREPQVVRRAVRHPHAARERTVPLLGGGETRSSITPSSC